MIKTIRSGNQTWLENPPFIDDFPSYKPPVIGHFSAGHVWLLEEVNDNAGNQQLFANCAAKPQQNEDPKNPNGLADSLNGVNDWHSHSWVGRMLGLCKVAQQPYEVGTSCEKKCSLWHIRMWLQFWPHDTFKENPYHNIIRLGLKFAQLN